jgi:hypothetical protein
MTDPDELGATLASVAAAFDGLGVRWAIGGSVASSAYGEPRATNDIDVIALLDATTAREVAKRLGPTFYADGDAAAAAARHHRSFNVIDQRSFIKVDVFVPGAGPLGEGQLTRAIRIELLAGAPPLPVLAPEDVILQKLAWFRAGGETSERQWRDLVAVLRTASPDLDDAYLDSVAGATDLGALLARARQDARG